MILHLPVERIETEKRRLVVLIYLAKAPGYAASAQILTLECRRLGVPTTTDQLMGAIAWLEEQELVTSREGGPGDIVARVTARGRDVADGNVAVPGVMRPDP